MSSSFRALRTRNYRLWASGTVVSNIGTWMQRTAQDWLVLTVLTKHSGFATGVTTGLQFAPLLLLSAHAGVLADRLPKRRLLMCTQTLMALSAAILGVLVVTDSAQLWEVFVCASLLGIATAFDNPARQAFVSEIVERKDVTSAVSLNSASFNLGRLVGPGVAGVLISAFGTGPSFLINAASFIAVLIALARMNPADMFKSERPPRRKGQVREGIRYVRSRPDILLIFFVTGMVGTFALNFQITSALMASGAFHAGPREYGLLGSVMAVGALAGAVLAARRVRPRLHLLTRAGAAFGTMMIVAALMPTYVSYAVALIPVGLLQITLTNSCNTAVQLSTPTHMRGRVIALYLILLQGTTPFGAPLIGWIGTEFGARWSVIAGGASVLLAIGTATWVLHRRPYIRTGFVTALRDAGTAHVADERSDSASAESIQGLNGQVTLNSISSPQLVDGAPSDVLAHVDPELEL